MTTCLPDAATRLAALLHERQCQPFAWGARDCCTFAFDCAQAITGRDARAGVRGTYSTYIGARRELRRLGGLHGLCARLLGPEIQDADVRNGDVALLRTGCTEGQMRALGVAWNGCVLGQGAAGLVVVSRQLALRWWRAA